MGPKTVVFAPHITYYISMKKLFLLLLICATLPAGALNYTALERAITAAPTDEPVYQIYSMNKALNAKRAIRLGYKNFQLRINTPNATFSDTQIAILITTRFQPFFDKLNRLEQVPQEKRPALTRQYSEEFADLVAALAKLLLKNQHRYSNSTFLDDTASLEETLQIIQEAIARRSF